MHFLSYDNAIELVDGIHKSIADVNGISANYDDHISISDGTIVINNVNVINRATNGFSQVEINGITEASKETPFNVTLKIPEDPYYLRPPLEVLHKIENKNFEKNIEFAPTFVRIANDNYNNPHITKYADNSYAITTPTLSQIDIANNTTEVIGDNELDVDPNTIFTITESESITLEDIVDDDIIFYDEFSLNIENDIFKKIVYDREIAINE